VSKYWKHIDDFFRDKLGSYRETPPADVWDALDKRLDGLQPGGTTIKPGGRWMWYAAAVAVVFILGVPVVNRLVSVAPSAGKAGNTAVAANTPASSAAQAAPTAAQAAPARPVDNTVQGIDNDIDAVNKVSESIDNQNINNNSSAGRPGAKANYVRTRTARHSTAAKVATRSSGGSGSYANNSTSSEVPATANEHQYASGGNPAPLNESTNNGQATASPDKPSALTSAVTKALQNAEKQSIAAVQNKKSPVEEFRRFEAGLKVGFEAGTNENAAEKWVVSPYIQYNLNGKWSLMAQPAVKGAMVTEHSVGSSQSYYSVNSDGVVQQVGNVTSMPRIVGGTYDTLYAVKYNATQSHDSIVKSYRYGGNYTELELPILLKYKIVKQLSVYGGVNVLYSRTAGFTTQTKNYNNISRSASAYDTLASYPVSTPAATTIIPYTGNNINEYKDPYTENTQSSVRLGYMIGFTYQYNKRWLLDALMEHSPYKTQLVNGFNANAPLSSAYFRLSIGYKLTK
jgi:hypothetical protein